MTGRFTAKICIPVTGKDAERLLQSGVIADVDVLRKRVLASQPSVSVTTG
jgi:hypothetical protein